MDEDIIKNNMIKQQEINSVEMLHAISLKKESQPLQMIVVKKEREEEYDKEIDRQWKEARSNFFNQQTKKYLRQVQMIQQLQTKITQIFIQAIQDEKSQKLSINLNKEGVPHEYQQRIEQLNQSLKLINQQFSRRQKEASAITQISRLKLTQLRVIDIQYDLNVDQQYRYEICAFELFKIVHENKGLFSVTIKGVLVKSFKQFIRSMAQITLNQSKSKEQWHWMKSFNPSRSLKLVIDTQNDFYLTKSNEDLCAIKNLAQFGALLQQLSVISVRIKLEEYKQMAKQRNALQELQEQLKSIGKIKIAIDGFGCSYSDFPFTLALQMLSSLTTIAQLQFSRVIFRPQVGVNRFLAMEQILSTIFQNNTVTHLKLYNCKNFPVFPTIKTLQSMSLQSISFRRQLRFMSDLTQSNLSLQSIKYSFIDQKWRIQEQLFNQLQSLCIRYSRNMVLHNLTHSPSNIKQLTIKESNVGSVGCLSILFTKLVNITSLVLYQIDFGHQLLCTVPSSHLTLLSIQKNNEFANQGLEAIDKKWPKLRQLTLRRCPNLSKGSWSACEFKGLMKLRIDPKIAIGHSIREQLRGRGIQVYQ